MMIYVSGIGFRVENAEETLRMGGPYTGDVYFNDELIIRRCIVDNFIYQDDLLFYVQYHQINYYKFFTINFRNLTNSMVFQFDREFEMVHIKQFITPSNLEIFLAFHDQLPDTMQIFNFDEEDFDQIENSGDLKIQ